MVEAGLGLPGFQAPVDAFGNGRTNSTIVESHENLAVHVDGGHTAARIQCPHGATVGGIFLDVSLHERNGVAPKPLASPTAVRARGRRVEGDRNGAQQCLHLASSQLPCRERRPRRHRRLRGETGRRRRARRPRKRCHRRGPSRCRRRALCHQPARRCRRRLASKRIAGARRRNVPRWGFPFGVPQKSPRQRPGDSPGGNRAQQRGHQPARAPRLTARRSTGVASAEDAASVRTHHEPVSRTARAARRKRLPIDHADRPHEPLFGTSWCAPPYPTDHRLGMSLHGPPSSSLSPCPQVPVSE